MWWKTLIREPNHGERFLPLLFTGAMAAYLLIFWYIGKENHAAELELKEELLWEKKQDSIRMAEAALLNIPTAEPSLTVESNEGIKDSPDQSPQAAASPVTTGSGGNPQSSSIASDPAGPGTDTAPVISPPTVNRYHIIAGSFSTDPNAQDAAANFRKQGFNASVVLRSNPDGSVSRLVALKSFGNHEDAAGFRNEVRKKTGIEAWIFTSQP